MDNWFPFAACNTDEPDEPFALGPWQNSAKATCRGCPVRTPCLAEALDNKVEFGVWGGMSERERRALLRRRPGVTSWRHLLKTALADYMRSIENPHTQPHQEEVVGKAMEWTS
ncbi:WhiB family transcriptional regulator [Streptomyces erythrochromogenes]|uniref:WhiB family transcriptional regulator n=1 Tax=Streptomyces erythrochromogenes TaxID=285574 RepID=UPI0036768949